MSKNFLLAEWHSNNISVRWNILDFHSIELFCWNKKLKPLDSYHTINLTKGSGWLFRYFWINLLTDKMLKIVSKKELAFQTVAMNGV